MTAPAAEPRPPAGDSFRTLYETGDWFGLRDAVTATPAAPAIYRAVVAAAFHRDAEADRLIRELTQANADSWEARVAAQWAGPLRLRREMHQRVGTWMPSRVGYIMRDRHLHAPVTINGHNVVFLFDTGAALSLVSESGAKKLELELEEAEGRTIDGGANRSVRHRYFGVARNLVIGGQTMRDVLFIVLPDDTPFFAGFDPSERGVIGLPVIQALGTVRWNRTGTLEFGFPCPARRGAATNLAFVRERLVSVAWHGRNRVFFTVDTGADYSNLFIRFRDDYPQLVRDAKTEPRQRAGVSGPLAYNALVLPSLTFVVGGVRTVYEPAEVSLDANIGEGLHGNLGLDLLEQSRATTLDFDAMQLSLDARN